MSICFKLLALSPYYRVEKRTDMNGGASKRPDRQMRKRNKTRPRTAPRAVKATRLDCLLALLLGVVFGGGVARAEVQPAFFIQDAQVQEGNEGLRAATFPVSLLPASSMSVSVAFATADGSAHAGSDYLGTNGVLVFPPGRTNLFLRVFVQGDNVGEPRKNFLVNLSSASNATIVKAQGIGTILDDDPPANDGFADRTVLSGSTVTTMGFNDNATQEVGEPLHAGNLGGKSVWWTWTAPSAGRVTITTAGSDFDTTLGVYTGTSLTALVPVASDHASAGPGASQVILEATPGQTYQIAVDGWNGVAGNIVLGIGVSSQRPFLAGQNLRRDFWGTDGTVNAIVATNGVVYVGGQFSYVYAPGEKVASYDLFTGTQDREFPSVLGSAINVILADGNGGWFLGGRFSEVGGVVRSNLAHVLSDHSVDPAFQPNPNDAVHALALTEGTLLVGGEFSMIGGEWRQRLAAVELTNNQVTAWAPAADGSIEALLVWENVVFAGGYFSQLGGQPRHHLAALDLATGITTPWNANADGAVLALEVMNDRLLAGGFFNVIDFQPRNGLAALDLNSGHATEWNPDPQGGKVTSLGALCNQVYVGGYFTNLGGASRLRLGAVDGNSGLATSWNPAVDRYYSGNIESYVTSLAIFGEKLFVGGQFSRIGGQARRDLAVVDAGSGAVLNWSASADGGVSALAVSERAVVAGFQASPNGVVRQNLAAFDEATGRLTDWNPASDAAVFALVVAGDRVFAGGNFTNAGGAVHQRLVALDRSTGQAIANWNVTANNTVSALAIAGDTLFVGGSFTAIAGQTRNRLAALNATTGQLLANWSGGADGSVEVLLANADTLFVAGNFDTIASQTRHKLAALNATTGQALPWNPGADARVRTLALAGNTLFVGGDFAMLGNQARAYLGAVDVSSGALAAWNPGADAEVRALAASDGVVYVGGSFLSLGGQPRLGLGALRFDGSVLDWNPGISESNRVNALTLSVSSLCVGGRSGLGLTNSPSLLALAVFPAIGAPVVHQAPQSQAVMRGESATLIAGVGGQQPLSYQWRLDGTNLLGATNATLVVSNAQPERTGVYVLVANNNLGTVTCEAALTVLDFVSILASPGNRTVLPGANVTLSVIATGSPPPMYQWRLNGVNIPSAVTSTLVLTNVQPRDSGSYDVVAGNRLGAVVSAAAVVVVSSPVLPFTDSATGSNTLNLSASGFGSGSNVGATRTNSEPNHAGKIGGKSVWLKWTAPDAGVATFSTRGSSFDTLLGIYTDAGGGEFNTIAGDEDRGGFLTSEASFNATEGTSYLIAVDGYAGASGNIVLTWNLDTTAVEFPRITTQPLSRSVSLGADVSFEVAATSPSPVTYQWLFGCQEITGATNATLTIHNVHRRNVGSYWVRVLNDSTFGAESAKASLEIGADARVVSQEKFADLYLPLPAGGTNLLRRSAKSFATAFVSVSLGIPGSQLLNNSNAPGSKLLHCGVPDQHSKWYGLQPLENAVLEVDTIGSAINTVLAIYTLTDIMAPLVPVQCNNDGAPDHMRSLVRFNATQNVQYLIAVDGVNGAQGDVRLNWKLGVAPLVSPGSPPNPVVTRGGDVNLSVVVSNSSAPAGFQWLWNGAIIPGATQSNLPLSNLQGPQSGVYRVIVSNFAGVVTSTIANLTVDVPLQAEQPRLTSNGGLRFQVAGNPGQRYVLEGSGDLRNWAPLVTNQLTGYEASFVDTNVWRQPKIFYRVLP